MILIGPRGPRDSQHLGNIRPRSPRYSQNPGHTGHVCFCDLCVILDTLAISFSIFLCDPENIGNWIFWFPGILEIGEI